MKPTGIALLSFLIMTLLSTTAYAQKKVTKKLTSNTVIDTRSENPNIISEAPIADEPEIPSPASSCKVQVANYTGYYVNIYIDGYYRGQVSPFGGGTVKVSSGYTSIYCITAGKTREWKDAGNCKSIYTYKLYP